MTSPAPDRPFAAVRERVRAQLRAEITAGRLRPGDRLVERELAERLGVSRVPVREALQALTNDGFVTALSPRRLVVRQLTRENVVELFEIREALEVYAAGLAAERATPEDLAELTGLLDSAELVGAPKGDGEVDGEAVTELNTAFHDRILATARNGLLLSVLEPVQGPLRWLTRRNEHWPTLLAEHRRLLSAIASGDSERARACALGHIRSNREVSLAELFGPTEA